MGGDRCTNLPVRQLYLVQQGEAAGNSLHHRRTPHSQRRIDTKRALHCGRTLVDALYRDGRRALEPGEARYKSVARKLGVSRPRNFGAFERYL